MEAREGDTIAAALFANGIRAFGTHHADGSPQGIFCANGQCAQCAVIADGLPVKACMVPAKPGMAVRPAAGLSALPETSPVKSFDTIDTIQVECLVIGGGPAGLSAAIELGKLGVRTLVVDDKSRLGGKLVLQTHRFFGSIDACYAGTRGMDIADRLAGGLAAFPSVEAWTDATAVAVYSDKKVGVVREGRYLLVEPKAVLAATGAREKPLAFKGNTLPGVFGAGAFQTLVNRDLVRPSERLFIVGGGNVGLIAGYHALQAGIQVVGLAEALPDCGGYKVHKDKLARMGVPIYVSHTILRADGAESVESVTIAAVDGSRKPIPDTEKTFACDTLLVAVGLDPVDELYRKALEFDMPVFAAGDADEVAEASAAIFSGKIRGLEIARALGHGAPEIPADWIVASEILRSRPGLTGGEAVPDGGEAVYPVIHCSQEIPCNPCASICPQGIIAIDARDIRKVPEYVAAKVGKDCIGCGKCVAICPGLAITLVDTRGRPDDSALATIPYEFGREALRAGDRVTVTDTLGAPLGEVEVARTRIAAATDRTMLVQVRAPLATARRIAGIAVQRPAVSTPLETRVDRPIGDSIACRCERVRLADIEALIRGGSRDINEIKAITRAGMGACGGKTCEGLIKRAFRERGIPMSEVNAGTSRPLFVEVPLGAFAGLAVEERVGHA